MTFYNTVGLSGLDLKSARMQAAKQEDLVLTFFELNRGMCISPQDVHREVMQHAPLTSVRRAISNLTKKNKLVKCKNRVMGIYGIKTFTWRLA